MVAFVYRMPSGIPGDISRRSEATVITKILNSASAFSAYGLFGKMASGKFVPIGSGDAASAVYGLLARPFPTQSRTDPLGTSTPPTTGPCDVMRRGFMTVKNNAGTAADGGQVYVRVANAAADKPIGGIEAAADGGNTIAIASCFFTCAADASGNVEIEFNL